MEAKPAAQPAYLMPQQNQAKAGNSNYFPELISQVNSLNTRLRMIEERYTNVRRKSQLTEHNMLSNQKKATAEFRTLSSEINDLKHSIRELNEKVAQIIEELPRFAKKHDLKTLNTYVNLWDMSRFVSREEARKLIKKYIGEKYRGKEEYPAKS